MNTHYNNDDEEHDLSVVHTGDTALINLGYLTL